MSKKPTPKKKSGPSSLKTGSDVHAVGDLVILDTAAGTVVGSVEEIRNGRYLLKNPAVLSHKQIEDPPGLEIRLSKIAHVQDGEYWVWPNGVRGSTTVAGQYLGAYNKFLDSLDEEARAAAKIQNAVLKVTEATQEVSSGEGAVE